MDAAAALAELQGAYWEYRSYRADLLPEISFTATVPSYRRQYSPYMNDAGDYSFVRNNYLDVSGELSLSQNIWLTGGKVSLSTSLDFMRQFGSGAYNRFMSIPVALTLSQPVFGNQPYPLEPPHRAGALRGGESRIPVGHRGGGHEVGESILLVADGARKPFDSPLQPLQCRETLPRGSREAGDGAYIA